LIGVDVACLLYGCLLAQLGHYLERYSKEEKWLRLLVMISALIVGVNVGFAVASQYVVFVTHSGDRSIWTSSPWPTSVVPLTAGLSALLVQCFFASRVVRFQGRLFGKILGALISLASQRFDASRVRSLAKFRKVHVSIADRWQIWAISSCVCDALVSFSMIGLLYNRRRNTHFRKTRNMLKRLIAQSIQTGTVTTVVMVVMFVMYETSDSKSQAYIVCELALGPLYVNVMLYVLNARERLAAVDTLRCNSSDIELPTNHDSTSTQNARATLVGGAHM
ncbi:uncharacterized protein SCHCODRAFT_02494359, partial [Schizophyllum commune H4-8]|uniref:uncharacterized protein n=1 Tax=Schizophyllum commune (strain H4-8 / FGSC 9210) TaxID=578458 RepID=UPI002160CDDF